VGCSSCGVLACDGMGTHAYRLDPTDPRAPSVEEWAAMSDLERQQAVEALPSELPSREQDLARALEQAQAEAENEKARAEQQQARAEQQQARAERLAARLRELGMDVDDD
jgi:hypothetical protein